MRKTLKIKTRLLLTVGFVAAMLAASSGVALWRLSAIEQGVEQVMRGDARLAGEMAQFVLSVSDLVQHEACGKRDWRRVQPETEAEEPLLLRLAAHEPDPAFAAEMADQYRQLFAELADDELRTIATRKLEGFTNEEIAAELDCAGATIERRLRLIRRTWEDKLTP